MAFTVTERGGTGTNDFVTSLASIGDSFTPATGDLILFCAQTTSSGVTAVNAIASWSATFSQISEANGIEVFGAFVTGSSPTAGQLDCTLASGRISTHVVQIAGADSSGSVADAIPQSPVTATGYDVRTSLALGTLSTFASSTNLCFTFGVNNDETKAGTPQSGFTEIFDEDISGERFCTYFQEAEELSPTFDYEETLFQNTQGISFEIAEAVTAVTPEIVPPLPLRIVRHSGRFL